jgi:transposase-like protein
MSDPVGIIRAPDKKYVYCAHPYIEKHKVDVSNPEKPGETKELRRFKCPVCTSTWDKNESSPRVVIGFIDL